MVSVASSPPASHTPSPLTTDARAGREGRACGKVILLGEHAVVYGVPALAVGIDRGAVAHAVPRTDGRSQLDIPAWSVSIQHGDDTTDLAKAFTAVTTAARLGKGAHGVLVTASTELPPGGGLGCSAALGVAVARALVPDADDAVVMELATEWERVFHGNPSGIDACVAASGGAILFEKGARIERLELPQALTVCVGSTGIPSSTKSMVDGLAQLRAKKPDIVEKAFGAIGSLVRNARLALEAGDITGLGKLMDLNQMLLSGLYLSTEEIERLTGLARDAGALGAKLTGAGGGGCVVALASDEAAGANIVRAWAEAGFQGFVSTVDGARRGGAP